MKKSNKNQITKTGGFALTQVLLALALGSAVSIGVVGYYNHTAKTQQTAVISDQVVQSAEKSKAEASVGLSQDDNLVINGISMTTSNGVATLTSMEKSQCEALQASLQPKGTISSSCLNSNTALNTITFTPTSTLLAASNNAALTAGTADAGATDAVTDPTMTGTTTVTASSVSSGSTSGSFASSGESSGSTSTLSGGGTGTVITGGTVTSPSSGTPPIYTGSATMACSWRLANSTAFATQNLGTRATPCSSGYVSTSDQNGTRTFSCADPNAAVDPVGTDTWTGGTCSTTCATRLGTGSFVTTSLGTRATSCPSGQVSTSNQTGTRTWSCANSGAAVDPVSTDTWTGGSCATTCGTRLGTGSFVTTSLGTRATSCPTGQQSTSNQTGTRTWSCANSSLAVDPTSTDTWTGGSCGVTCVPLASQTQNIGCPANQIGNHWQQRDSSCPNPTGSPVWGSWYDTSNTCALNTSCVGYGSSYAWNGSSCQITCASHLGTGSYNPVSGTQSQAMPQSSCPSGTTATGTQTRTFTWYCSSTFASAPTESFGAWTGGTCKTNAPIYNSTNIQLYRGSTLNANLTCNSSNSCTGNNGTYAGGSVGGKIDSTFNVTCGTTTKAIAYTCSTPSPFSAGNINCSESVSVGSCSCTAKITGTAGPSVIAGTAQISCSI